MYKEINIKVENYVQIIDKDVVFFTGNLNIYKLIFDFIEEVNDLTKIVTFTTTDNKVYKASIIDNIAYIPFEALENTGTLEIGVYAYKGEELIRSYGKTSSKVRQGSYVEDSETENKFNQNDFERYLELNNQILAEMRELLAQAPSGGTGTSNYNDLENRPSINGVVLEGNKTLEDLGIASKEEIENIEPVVPVYNTDTDYVEFINFESIPNAEGSVF